MLKWVISHGAGSIGDLTGKRGKMGVASWCVKSWTWRVLQEYVKFSGQNVVVRNK